MSSKHEEGNSLDKLQTREQIDLLDTIDSLRNQGLAHHNINLPQLIVCGDQSSGKSSVLEGLTRLKFPTKEKTCTAFATELILRKHPVVAISCKIVPNNNRQPAHKEQLENFQRFYSSREDFNFAALIEDAKTCMAIGLDNKFSEDVLQVKYTGPDLPSLTIVDLPGIIHHDDTKDGVKTVRNLVERYMANEKSIILAVLHATTDTETQSVLEYVKNHDPHAFRTLGIITKPDKIDVGSETEQAYLQLARNESMTLKLGWHVVKNRAFGELEQTDDERDESERQFLNRGVWASLPRTNVGIEQLRAKLSRVLLHHICEELPSLRQAIQSAATATEASLKALGTPRDEPQQQRTFLMAKAQRFQELTRDALRGLYSDPFFAISPSSTTVPPTRLRTEIHNLNLAFTQAMYQKGHQYNISDSGFTIGDPLNPQPFSTSIAAGYETFPDPTPIPRTAFLKDHIEIQIRLSRPSGLPSLVNTWVIGEVFRMQSSLWEAIARQHLNSVYQAVHTYIDESLSRTMDEDTYEATMQTIVDPDLEARWQRLESKLDEFLVPYQSREPITYDPTFTGDLHELRMKRLMKRQRGVGNDGGNAQHVGAVRASLASPSAQLLTETMDDFTSMEILDLMDTYYKKSISVFISNITVLAIENCLIHSLPSILSPELVINLSEDDLAAIASESEAVTRERSALTRKLAALKAGKATLESLGRKSGKMGVYSSPRAPSRQQPSPQRGTRRPASRTPEPVIPQIIRPQTPVSGSLASSEDEEVHTPPPAVSNTANVTPPQSRSSKPTKKGGMFAMPRMTPLTPPKSPRVEPARTMLAGKLHMKASVESDEDEEL